MTTPATAAAVRSAYRELLHIARHQKASAKRRTKSLQEIRSSFRENSELTAEERLKKAQDRVSFLRMTTPLENGRRHRHHGEQAGKWVYTKDGEKLQDVNGTLRDDKGRVHTNWDGKNMDPCSVKRHYHGLRRSGFANNQHAKGIF